jgi:hypothetical protein
MGSLSTWESVLLGAMLILILFWFGPGINATMERSRNAEKDWRGLLLPIGAVVLFVIFLIMIS